MMVGEAKRLLKVLFVHLAECLAVILHIVPIIGFGKIFHPLRFQTKGNRIDFELGIVVFSPLVIQISVIVNNSFCSVDAIPDIKTVWFAV